jgi:hypothetical protein
MQLHTQDASLVVPFSLLGLRELPSSSCSSSSLSLSLPSSSDIRLTSDSSCSSAARGDSAPAQLAHSPQSHAKPLPSSEVPCWLLPLLLLWRLLLSLLSLASDSVRQRAEKMLLWELMELPSRSARP